MEIKENLTDPKPDFKPDLKPQIVEPLVQNQPIPEKPLVKPISSKKINTSTLKMILASFLVVILGVVTGWFLAGSKQASYSDTGTKQSVNSKGEIEEAGIGEESEYGSTIDGILKEGGIKGEGTHYIDRGLGEGKYVYLTSSVVDLDSFIDREVTVWGETISAKYASWMIDVGKVKVKK